MIIIIIIQVRAGKKFLPHVARFGIRYDQRRKYNKDIYVGTKNDGYPPVVDNPPEQIDGKPVTVFYCIEEDLNRTLVNKALNSEDFDICNISDELVICPIEIECKTVEADICCEDEEGRPHYCGDPIPEEYISQYGGYEDDWNDASENINQT